MLLCKRPFRLELVRGMLVRNGKRLEPQARTLGEMHGVLFDRRFFAGADRHKRIYLMYRELEDVEGIRYDVTVIPPLRLGSELVKTYGHYHPVAEKGLSFCEIYEVLSGEAHYILQKRGRGRRVGEVILISAKKGDKLIIPPNYGHVTINPGKKALVMANLVYDGFESDYTHYKKLGGAAYFETADGILLPNERYDLRGLVPKAFGAEEFNSRFLLWKKLRKGNLLELAERNLRLFDFLKKPGLCR